MLCHCLCVLCFRGAIQESHERRQRVSFTTKAPIGTETKQSKLAPSTSQMVGHFVYGDHIFIISTSDSCADPVADALEQIWNGEPDLSHSDKSWQKQVIDCVCRNIHVPFTARVYMNWWYTNIWGNACPFPRTAFRQYANVPQVPLPRELMLH